MKNNTLLLLILAVAGVAIVLVAMQLQKTRVFNNAEAAKSMVAPVSGYRLYLNQESVLPGKVLVINEIETSEAVSVRVEREVNSVREQMGMSESIKAGLSKNVEIKLNKIISNGDVLIVSLVDSSNNEVKDSNGNSIAVSMPVGMVMGHYHNEY